MAFKDDFYLMLQDDFHSSSPVSNAYIYKYIAQEKKEKANIKRDGYSILLSIDEELKENKNDKSCLIGLLEVLSSNSKIKMDHTFQEFVSQYGCTLGGEEAFKGVRKNIQKYAKLAELLKNYSGDIAFSPEQLSDFCQMAMEKMILIDIGTFFYDVGYPLSKTLKPSRKRDRTINIIDGFLTEKHLTLTVPNSNTTVSRMDDEAYLSQCEQLYEIMKKTNKCEAVIPLVIDERTASGLYIIGKKYYENKAWIGVNLGKRYQNNSCIYGIIGFRDRPAGLPTLEINVDCDIYNNDSYGFNEDIHEAIKWLKNGEDNGKGDLYGGFADCNGFSPENCPDIFLRYFERDDFTDSFSCSEEEIMETRRMFEQEENMIMKNRR